MREYSRIIVRFEDAPKSSSATPPNYELTEPVLFGELVGSKQTIEVLVESQPTVQRANGNKARVC